MLNAISFESAIDRKLKELCDKQKNWMCRKHPYELLLQVYLCSCVACCITDKFLTSEFLLGSFFQAESLPTLK